MEREVIEVKDDKETKVKPEIKPVASGKKKEKSMWKKFKESFIAEEASDLKEYIIKDLVIPTIKDAICDGVSNGLSLLLYGERYYGSTRRDRDRGRRYNYSSQYSYRRDRDRDDRRRDRDRDDRRSSHNAYDFELIECETKSEALDILDQMDNILREYESVSIADMYDLAGVSRNPEDCNYGWTNLDHATIEKTRDNFYIIQMPRAKSLK